MSVHYKFKSALDYDTVTFDGLHISVGDLKAAISQQKRIGKTSDFDLQITNAQTKEVYVDDNALIPKNTSLLVARVPLSQQPKKQWESSNNNQSAQQKDVSPNKGVADLSRMEGSEQDKINAMISQSTFDYDPSNYQKIRGQNQRGVVPTNYICYKCQKRGHWIKDCPAANSGDPVEIRRSTGIPRSFMVPVEGPKAPGAMMTPSGTFAVPVVDHEAYLASENAGGGDSASSAAAAPDTNIPDELICSLCRDLLTDAVMIPCCGNSFCDECIRGALLESEDHECPDCREKEIAPTTLIPNRFLRNSVSSFRNQTGYSRRTPHRPSAAPVQQRPPVMDPPQAVPGLAPPNGPTAGPSTSGPPPVVKPDLVTPPNIPMNMPRIDEQRASTPTVDERRDPMASQVVFNRGPPQFMPRGLPPAQHFNNPRYGRPMDSRPFKARFPPDPYQPPPPGIKDSPSNGHGEDPLEAFNRMIREKEMRAKRREEERRRALSGSRSRSRSVRSVRSVRSARSPRSPRSPRPLRSPRAPRSPRSPRSPRARPRSRGPSRLRYSRSRSMSRGRLRRSPWSPRRRRTRDRSLSLSRSPSPRRRHRSPLRYRSPLRSPGPRSPPRSPLRTPLRTPMRSPPRSPPRSLPRSPPRSPLRSPRRSALRSPLPRPLSPHRYAGVYDELLSPPRRSVDPPFGARYGPRSNLAPPAYPLMGLKQITPMGNIPVQPDQPPGYRGRYDAPPFEDIPPGLEPPVPGFEPSPFEKPSFGPSGLMERERLPPPNYRDPYRPPTFIEGLPGYRDMPIPPVSSEIPVHVGDQPTRYRDSFRPGPPYRDQGPVTFREGQSYRDPAPQGTYRDPNFRGGPPPFRDSSYRSAPYRDGGFRDNPPHNNFREGGGPFRPPSADPRETVPPNYNDPNYRDGYREDSGVPRDHSRSGQRPNVRNRGAPRRNPNIEQERHRDREGRDRDRYNENRDPSDRMDRAREIERRSAYDKNRETRGEGREERPRDYERNKELEKERDFDRSSPDKKVRVSPKRSREMRDKKRSESRGRSRDRDRDNRRDKKEERSREKTSADRNKEHKDKEKKIKDRKKKKREKEKDIERKKKRDKKEKKEKDNVKKEDENIDKSGVRDDKKESQTIESDKLIVVKTENPDNQQVAVKSDVSLKTEPETKPNDDLYGDEAAEAVDKEIIQNYVKANDNDATRDPRTDNAESKEEPFDGIELQANTDELDLKVDSEVINQSNKEMLAPMPELSKWEVDEDNVEKVKELGEVTSPEEAGDGSRVTSDVIKRAENAIFAKAVGSLRPIEIKKISSDRLKLYGDEQTKPPMNNIQITVPVTDSESRSIEINDKKKRHSKTPPPRLSVKERLGGKVEDLRKSRETRLVHSTVERVKSRSKTPKKEQQYRRVTVEKEKNRKQDSVGRSELVKSERRIMSEGLKVEKHRGSSPHTEKKDSERYSKDDKKSEVHDKVREKNTSANLKGPNIDRERKKSTLDEAHFEPDYDENVESDNEVKDECIKKRDRSASATGRDNAETKKPKLETDSIKLDLTNVKKKPDTESESSSGSEFSSSSSSSDARKRKKKKKRVKKKKKKAASDSESESDSSSEDHKKKKKKRKHKKKSSKKKKKSKHK